MMVHRKLTFLWFLMGLGSRLQVVASLSITELLVLIAAPFIFIKDYHQMRRDGVMPFFILSLMVVFGCLVASLANHTHSQYVLRGLAVTCLVACSIVFSHWILRRDPNGFKWFVLAIPISAILSTFVFRASVEVTSFGDSVEEIMSGPLYWISRVSPLVLAPTKGWYLHMPWFVNVFSPLFVAGFAIMSSVSGRSAALSAVGFVVLVIIGGKTQRTMSRVSRHFMKLVVMGVISIGLAYSAYKVSAIQGWLGEDARRKYEMQTHGGEGGIGRLILGGRGDSFIGLLACRDKPIIGWGPWAIDENGYTEEFMARFGTMEDYDALIKSMAFRAQYGITVNLLRCHSYITEFWAWYGIWGLVFWLYVVFVLLRYLKKDVAFVPQWYAWLACSIPGMFWGIFFSPFQDRFGCSLFVVACLMARAVRKGTFVLPLEMRDEVVAVERK